MDNRAEAAAPERARLGFVFYTSCALSLAFVVFGLLFPARLSSGLAFVREGVVGTVGPVYPLVVTGLLLLVLVLWLSPVGRVRLGGPDARPEFGAISWIAMLISAGVGLSFLFWGTAEPLIHLADPPYGAAEAGSPEAARLAMRYSFLFWGPHAWAIYAVVAISIGYSSFTRGRPMLVSAALRPLLGRRVDGRLGDVVDVLSVVAILFGVATSLGLGTGELSAGLHTVFGTPDTYVTKVIIIVSLMTVSTVSAMTGLGRGIRWLSLANITLCAVLLGYVLVVGPTASIVSTMGSGVAGFTRSLVPMSLGTEGAPGSDWTAGWIYFFWAWWIAWAPFVGTFIARISRGRTIAGVVCGVVLVPSAVTLAWFSVLGGTALQRETTGAVQVAQTASQAKSVATAAVFESLPLTSLTAAVVAPVLALLFITSADSASFMLGSATSGGHLKPPRPLRLMWSFAAAFAAVLLLSGGPTDLRSAAVVAALPFTVILVGLCLSLAIMLWQDREKSQLTS